jgi:hypothetical protein
MWISAVVAVPLAAAAVAVEAAHRQRHRRSSAKASGVLGQNLLLDAGQADAGNPAVGMPGKNSATSERDRPTASKQ